MSVPSDVETDCPNIGPPEGHKNTKHLQFDPKFRHLGLPAAGGTSDRFDSQDSGIDSFRSVDSSVCFSSDSGRVESLLTSISENPLQLSQQLDDIHISESREHDKTRTLFETIEDQDEAFVDYNSSIEDSLLPRPSGTSSVCEFGVFSTENRSVFLTDDAFDQDLEGDTPLHLAIIHKKEDFAQRFIFHANDSELLNIRNFLAQTPLHLAVLTRQPHICRALVLAGAQVDSVDRNGDTPLHIACKLTDDECIRALTERVSPLEVKGGLVRCREPRIPQDLELRNFDGFTCVHILGFLANSEHLQYLVHLGANINTPDGKSGRTALHYAVEMGNLRLAQFLVEVLRADVDAMTFDLCTPLHLAVGRQLTPFVMFLMESRADADVKNFEGDRPRDLSQDINIMMCMRQPDIDEDMEYTDIKIQGH